MLHHATPLRGLLLVDPKSTQDTATQDQHDQLVDDDDEYETESQSKGFYIKNQFEEPETKILTVRELHSLIHEGTIDLSPPYQRDVVWSNSKQSLLVESLFRNLYVPPVVFAVKLDEEGYPTRVCVDGKQRLTSIQRFLDGQIPYSLPGRKNFYFVSPEMSSSSRLQIPEKEKETFLDKQIACVQYNELTPGQEREIFQRVQLGVSLTSSEKMAAISSPWSEWITHLVQTHVACDDGLGETIDWETTRGREFSNIAHVVWLCDKQDGTPTAPKMEAWLSRTDEPEEPFKRDIDNVFHDLAAIATQRVHNECFQPSIAKRVAPAEFAFIGLLLYLLRNRSLTEKAAGIKNLRKDIRALHKDIRMNGAVGASLWDIVNQLRHNPTQTTRGSLRSTLASKRLRKGAGGNSEDDEDFIPGRTPVKKHRG